MGDSATRDGARRARDEETLRVRQVEVVLQIGAVVGARCRRPFVVRELVAALACRHARKLKHADTSTGIPVREHGHWHRSACVAIRGSFAGFKHV